MADTIDSTPTASKVSFLSTVEMFNTDYKQTVEDLSVEMFNIHISMLAASEENEKLVLKVKMLENKISSIRERYDINEMSIERLYGKLKTHEMEKEQRHIIYGQGTVRIHPC